MGNRRLVGILLLSFLVFVSGPACTPVSGSSDAGAGPIPNPESPQVETSGAPPIGTPIPSSSPHSTNTPTPTAAIVPLRSPPAPIVFEDSRSIVVSSMEGSSQVVYQANDGSPAFAPAFSPDCEWVAFMAPREDSMGLQADIAIVRIDGTDFRQLAASFREESSPSWSGDGTRVAFIVEAHQLYVMWVATGARAHIVSVDGSMGSLAWSPTSEEIAFLKLPPVDAAIWIVRADTGAVRAISTGAVVPHGGLSWSPDGARLAFVSEEELFVLDLASGATKRLLRLPGISGGTSWTPDASAIAFTYSWKDHLGRFHWAIYLIQLENSELSRLTSSGEARDPDICRSPPVP